MPQKKVTDDALVDAHRKRMTLNQAAEALGITRQAVAARWKALGLTPHRAQAKRGKSITLSVRPTTDKKLDVLARHLGLSRSAVVDRAVKSLMDSLSKTSKNQERGTKP